MVISEGFDGSSYALEIFGLDEEFDECDDDDDDDDDDDESEEVLTLVEDEFSFGGVP